MKRSIEPLQASGATAVNIELTLAQLSDGGFEFGINGVPFAPHTPVLAKLGDTQLWTVKNTHQVVASDAPARLLLPGAR